VRDGADLAAETDVGLPRSSLVKTNTPDVAAFVPVLDTAADTAPATTREPFRTKSDSVEVSLDSVRGPSMDAKQEPMRSPYASSPSANDLLERAAALGPARMTWESIVLTSDPILDEKRTPHVAERRERLTRVVKLALGACLAMCVVAAGVSAVSGDSTSTAQSSAASSVGTAKTVASKGIVPIEPLDGAKRGKAVHRPTPTVATAAIVRPKRR
jgi:hypothetical protein